MESDLILKREGRFVYSKRSFESYADKLAKEAAEDDGGRMAAVGNGKRVFCRRISTTTLRTTRWFCSIFPLRFPITTYFPSSNPILDTRNCVLFLVVVELLSWSSITSATQESVWVLWRALHWLLVIDCMLRTQSNVLYHIWLFANNKQSGRNNLFSHRFSSIYFLGLTAHPATMRALPPVGVHRRALQLHA